MTFDAAPQAESDFSRTASRRPMVVVLSAAVLGVALDRFAPTPAACGLTLAVAAWLVWLVLFGRRRRPDIAAVALLLCTAGLGAAWHHTHWHAFAPNEIGLFAREWSEPVCVRGRALAAPGRLPAPPFDPMRTMLAGDMSRLTIDVEAIRDRDRWLEASGRVTILVVGHLRTVRAGDRLQVYGNFASESPTANPGERDHAVDARHDRRLCGLRCDTPDCVSSVSPNVAGPSVGLLARMSDAIAELRSRGNQMLWEHLSHRRAGLAAAVLLGQREEVPRDEIAAYVQTGTVHLLAISGQHVGILAMALVFVLRLGWLSRRWGMGLVAILTVFYALLTDSQPPVLRATIVVVVLSLSFTTGRRSDGFNALALAGLIVLAINPADLFRVGPQLSFLAVATLIWFAARRWRRRIPDPIDTLLTQARPWPVRIARGIGAELTRLIAAGLVLSLVALPLTMHAFHLVSPWGMLLTPILVPPMAVALLSGLGVLVFGRLMPPLADLCGGLCDLSLSLISGLVETANSLPGSHFWVAGPPVWWLAGFYTAAAVAALWPRYTPSRKWCLALLSGWIALGLGAAALRGGGDELRCTILSVGHGSAAVLELPDGRTLVCDAGRLGSPDQAARAVAGCLWSRGHTHIDAIVISHADADHYNAVPQLLTQFSVGAVYVSPVMLESKSYGVAALFDSIRQTGVPLRTIWAGEKFDTGSVRVEVLHPPRKGILAAKRSMVDNANCIVLAVEYAGHRLLLPGDIETPGLDDLLAEAPWHCDLLTAPHHGSRNNDPEAVTRWCTPTWNVVSGSEDENLAAIRAASRRHGVQLLHTAEDGAVVATLRSNGVTVQPFRPRGVGRPPR